MARKMVIVTEQIHPAGVELLAREVEVVRPHDFRPDTLAEIVPDASGMIVRLAKVTADLLERAERLEVIGKHGVGIDNVDVGAASLRGIPIVTTPNANDEAVAEHALALMLVLARQIRECERGFRAGRFFQTRDGATITDLVGKTLGIVGVGRIGARLAGICARAFGMRVLAYDPYVSADRAAELGVEPRDLASLLAESDFVSIHTPLTPATRGLIGAAELAGMKRTAFLVNCARGGIVDEAALAEALEAGYLAGAGLDVFVAEPPSLDHPLYQLPNLVCTPHVAGGSQDALELMARMVAEDVLRVLRGEPARNVANRDLLPHL
jgi:D-3-phosphoglycerate dehydrogenase